MDDLTAVEGTSTVIRDQNAVLSALDRAKADAKKFRQEAETLQSEFQGYKEKASKLQERLVNENINKQLNGLGIPNAERLLKYIDTSKLDINDELEVAGLQEQITTLKADFPELFDPKVIVGGKANSGVSNATEVKLSASELQAKMVLGQNW
jgi:hypothetical protein